MALEVARLQAAFELLDEASPTIEAIEESLGGLEKVLGVTREQVQKNREALADMAKAGQLAEQALDALGITFEEYNQVVKQNEQAMIEAAEAMDRMHEEAIAIDRAMPKAGDGARAFAQAAEGLGGALTRVGSILTGVTAGLAIFMNQSRMAAVQAVESENLFDVSMGNMANTARSWSQDMAQSLGLNEYEIRKQVGTFNVMTTSMGLSEDAALDLSQNVTKLAYDMASFYNLDVEEATRKIQGGLTGEAESLKRLGIIVNETSVQQAAYRHGIDKSVDSMTNAEKTMARYFAIMDATAKAQGDLARTMDSPANAMRRFSASMEQLQIKFGTALLPVFQDFTSLLNNELVPVLNRAVEWFTNLDGPMKNFLGILFGIVTAVGPAVLALGQLVSTLGGLATAYAGLAAAQAAGAMGGAGAGLTGMLTAAKGFMAVAGGMLGTLALWAGAIVAVWTAATSAGEALDEFFGFASGDATINQATEDVGLFTAAISLIPDVLEFFKNVWGEVWKWASSFFEATVETISGVWNEFTAGFMEYWEQAESVFGPVLDALGAAWEAIYPAVETTAKWLWEVVKFVTPLDEMWAVLKKIGSTLSELASKTMEWAKAMMFRSQMAAAEKGQAAFLEQASILAGREIKTVQEATKVYQELQKAKLAKMETDKEDVKVVQDTLKATQDAYALMMKQNKEEERIKIAKKLLNQEKNKEYKLTIDQAEAVIKQAVALGYYKEKADPAAKATQKLANEAEKLKNKWSGKEAQMTVDKLSKDLQTLGVSVPDKKVDDLGKQLIKLQQDGAKLDPFLLKIVQRFHELNALNMKPIEMPGYGDLGKEPEDLLAKTGVAGALPNKAFEEMAAAAVKAKVPLGEIEGLLKSAGGNSAQVAAGMRLVTTEIERQENKAQRLAMAFQGVAELAGMAFGADIAGLISTGASLIGNYGDQMERASKMTDEAEKKAAKFNATISLVAGLAGALGSTLEKSTNPSVQKLGGALSGAAAGAKAGMAFGPWGAAIGAVGGAIMGFLGKAKKMREEMKKLKNEFIESHGGIEKLTAEAKNAGVNIDKAFKAKTPEQMKKQLEAVNKQLEAFNELLEMSGGSMEGLKQHAADAGISLQEIWDAKTPEEYLAAVEKVKKGLSDWDKANEKLNAAMDKYGITIDQLGPKFRQAGFDKMGMELFESFSLLKAAGVDVSIITEKMSADMSDYVNRAVAAGSTIPQAMKPMIDEMIKNGDLLDENGEAYESLEDAGITFAQTLEEGIASAVKAIEELVAVLAQGFNIPVNVHEGSGGGGGGGGASTRSGNTGGGRREDENSFAGGTGGFRDFGGGTPAMLHGVEAVVTPGQMTGMFNQMFSGLLEKLKENNTGVTGNMGSGGGDVSTVVNLQISENPMQTAETVEQMRKFTLETVEKEVARSLADAIAEGKA